MKIWYWRRKCSYNEIFKKDVAFDEVTKKQGFALSLENTFLE